MLHSWRAALASCTVYSLTSYRWARKALRRATERSWTIDLHTLVFLASGRSSDSFRGDWLIELLLICSGFSFHLCERIARNAAEHFNLAILSSTSTQPISPSFKKRPDDDFTIYTISSVICFFLECVESSYLSLQSCSNCRYRTLPMCDWIALPTPSRTSFRLGTITWLIFWVVRSYALRLSQYWRLLSLSTEPSGFTGKWSVGNPNVCSLYMHSTWEPDKLQTKQKYKVD